MDQNLSTVIIAIIGGVFSVITLLIQSRQNKVIDDGTIFMEKERELTQRLLKKQEFRDDLVHKMIILTMETNLLIMSNPGDGSKQEQIDTALSQAEQLKQQYGQNSKEIDDIRREYQMLRDLSSSVKTQSPHD